jgi:cytochrome c553
MKHLILAIALLSINCGKNASGTASDEPPSEGSATAQPTAPAPDRAAFEARSMFSTVCATCHGPEGKGDGQAAAGLNPKPRNYTDKAWQASVTDEDLRKTILYGGAGVGKSPVMPGTPQLKDKPAVLDELVKIVRSFGK